MVLQINILDHTKRGIPQNSIIHAYYTDAKILKEFNSWLKDYLAEI